MPYDRTIKKYSEPRTPEQIDYAIKNKLLYKGKFLWDNHFHSYYLQMKTIRDLKLNSVLEIGPGENITGTYLKSLGIDYKTMDIVEVPKPDISSSLEDCNPQDFAEAFDMVCAFQVLEHSPYENFKQNLIKMADMSKKYVFISIPYSGFGFKIFLNIHLNQNIRPTRAIKIFFPSFKKNRKYRPEFIKEFPWAVHYWEIGRKGFPLRRIKRDVEAAGLTIKKTFQSNNLFHYYILAEKR